MREVAMTCIFCIPVFLPFLHLSVLTYLPWSDLCFKGVKHISKVGIFVECTGCKSCVFQQVVNHLVVHSNATKESYSVCCAIAFSILANTGMILRRVTWT